MPASCQRSRFGFAVPDRASNDQVRVIKCCSIGMREGITEFTPFIDRARGFGGAMPTNSAMERDCLKSFFIPSSSRETLDYQGRQPRWTRWKRHLCNQRLAQSRRLPLGHNWMESLVPHLVKLTAGHRFEGIVTLLTGRRIKSDCSLQRDCCFSTNWQEREVPAIDSKMRSPCSPFSG